MIDRQARNKLAESLRHLVSGQISNDRFEDSFLPSHDQTCRAIYLQAWRLYSDSFEHKLRGSYTVSERDKRIIVRAILLLYSDYQYEWPRHPYEGPQGCLLRLVTLGLLAKRFDKEWEAAGALEVWPFLRKEDYEDALRKPRLLKGERPSQGAA